MSACFAPLRWNRVPWQFLTWFQLFMTRLTALAVGLSSTSLSDEMREA